MSNNEYRLNFFHGLGLSNEIWKPVFHLLKEYKVNGYELIGHGKNQCLREAGFKRLWSSVKETLDLSKKNIFIFHSAATGLIIPMLEDNFFPNKVILVEGNIIRQDAKWSESITDMENIKFSNYVKLLKKNSEKVLQSNLFIKRDLSELKKLSSGFTEVNKDFLLSYATEISSSEYYSNIQRALLKIHQSCLYLRGAESENWDSGYEIINKIGIQHNCIKDSKHYPMLDNPNELVSNIINFMSK